MMTSSQIRQSFLDFFKSKSHTLVPSSSLMPNSPGLLFTNAGMNQFVPIFLNQKKADVSKWAGVVPGLDTRAADTQKCIRAGGKHNDLEDVGLDTYHHTFFEMLGNWSFGDYFKQEAIDWAWELVVGKWKFPANRLYATVYKPGPGDPAEFDQEAYGHWEKLFKAAGLDPAVHIVNGNKKDNFWMMGETGPCGPCSEIHVDLTPAGDTKGSLVNQGDARCIEIWNLVFIQFNAQPRGGDALVAGSATGASQPLIEFAPLAAKHVDTGMGFERVTSIIQGTKGLTDFKYAKISNYETDIFRPIFDAIEGMTQSGRHEKTYCGTLPRDEKAQVLAETLGRFVPEQVPVDIAFRVIADHIRTLTFAIADGIQPSNEGRGYVLRRILRRAVRYGRTLGFHKPFFHRLVNVLADTMGDVFPEIRAKKKHVQEVIRTEEEAFNKTLDAGLQLFEAIAEYESKSHDLARKTLDYINDLESEGISRLDTTRRKEAAFDLQTFAVQFSDIGSSAHEFGMRIWDKLWNPSLAALIGHGDDAVNSNADAFGNFDGYLVPDRMIRDLEEVASKFKRLLQDRIREPQRIAGCAAFLLYDTYGFPLDLTELMARERGLTVDTAGFEKLMDEQRARARAAQKKEVISVSQIETTTPTKFVGYETLETDAKVVEVVSLKASVGVQASACPPGSLKAGLQLAVILDTSACYAEMGGQVGDTGELEHGSQLWRIVNTQKSGNAWLHFISDAGSGEEIVNRKSQIVNLSEVPAVGSDVTLTVEKSRRNAIERHHTVTHLLHWALHEVVSKEASQKGSFVGPDKLTFDFNSAPLTPAQVADIEKLVNERIVENAGVSWTEVPYADVKSRKDVMQFFGEKYGDVVRVVQIGGHPGKLDGYDMELCGGTHTRATGEIGLFRIVGENAIAAGVRRIEAVAGLTAYDVMKVDRELIKTVAGKLNSPIHELEKKIEALIEQQREMEKSLKAAQQREASNAASLLLEEIKTVNGIPAIIHNLGAVDGDFLQLVADALKSQFKGVVVLGGGPQRGAVALVASVSSDFTAKVQAGKIIQQIAPIVGGKGGGKPDNARGGGKDANKLDEALARAKSLL